MSHPEENETESAEQIGFFREDITYSTGNFDAFFRTSVPAWVFGLYAAASVGLPAI
jgi:hypothetical protein